MEQTFFNPILVQNMVYGLFALLLTILGWIGLRVSKKLDKLETTLSALQVTVSTGFHDMNLNTANLHNHHETRIELLEREDVPKLWELARNTKTRVDVIDSQITKIVTYTKDNGQ